MKTAKSNTLFVSRGFATLFLILLFLSGISTTESAEFFSSKGKSVIIYHDEYRFSPDPAAGYVVFDFRFGEEVLRDNAGGPSSTASNVYVRLRGESYDYEYFGNAPDLVVTFSSELLSNVIPALLRWQRRINGLQRNFVKNRAIWKN